jgi:hypothetical protein
MPPQVRLALHKAKHKAVAERIRDVIATGDKVVVFTSQPAQPRAGPDRGSPACPRGRSYTVSNGRMRTRPRSTTEK